jgi:hypothetical protein
MDKNEQCICRSFRTWQAVDTVAVARGFASTLPNQSCWNRGRPATVGGSTRRAIVYLRVIAQVSELERYRNVAF